MHGRGAQVINERLTPAERSEAARRAAKARWSKIGKQGRRAVGRKLTTALAVAVAARRARKGAAA